MKKVVLEVAIVASVLLTSCSGYKYVSTAPDTGKEINKKDVRVFLSESEVPANAKHIGFVISKSNNEKKVWRKAKKRAAEHGANAIMMVRSEEISAGQKMGNLFLGTGFKGKYKTICYDVPNEPASK
jgi:hypothetical protein